MSLAPLWEWLGALLPYAWLGDPGVHLFRRMLVAFLLLAPALGLLGVHVVNARYAFFTDAVCHATLAGLGVAAWTGWSPQWSLPLFAALFGVGVTALRRGGRLSGDAATGVAFALVTAAGICLVHKSARAEALMFGAMTVDDTDIWLLAGLLAATFVGMALCGNRLALVGLDGRLAEAHGIRRAVYEYAFSALLAVVVAVAARLTGILLVTALLVVPAAAGRYWARSLAAQCRWSVLIATVSAGAGYALAAQDGIDRPAGAVAVLCAGVFFGLGWLVRGFRRALPGR